MIERHHVRRVSHGKQQFSRLFVVIHRQHLIAARDVLWHQRQRIVVDDRVRQIDGNLTKALGERVANGRFGNEPQSNQNLAERHLGFALFEERNIQLIGRNHPAREQRLAQRQLSGGSVHMIHWLQILVTGIRGISRPQDTPIVSMHA